jgi:hypothetical protein
VQGYEKLQYVGYDLKKSSKGRWLLLAKFKGSSGYYDWAPKWVTELDKLYAAAFLVESLNGGHALEGFKQTYEMFNKESMVEALTKAKAIPTTPELHSEIERLRLRWKQAIEQAPEDAQRAPAIAILRSAGVKPVAIEDDTVVLAFRYPIHKERMETAENQQLAEKVVSNFLGHPCHVRYVHEKEDNHLIEAVKRLGAKIISVEEK